MITKIKTFQPSDMMRNVVKISSGTMIGQLVSILTLPIYTRIFGASIIGDWALFTSVATIINTFSDLGLSNAIMIEENEEETQKLFSITTTIVFSVSLLVGVFYLIYYRIFPSPSSITWWFYAIFIFVLTFTQQQVNLSYSWLNRQKKYGVLMKNPIINNVSAAFVAIPLGVMGFVEYGYYIGLIVGQIITLIHMRRKLPKVFLNFNLSDYKRIIKRHKEFCFYQMPANIAAQLKNQSPTIFISAFFGAEILGYYSVSMKVLKIPITFLANAIGKVYYQAVAEMQRKGQEIGAFTYRNMNRAMKIAIGPMILLLSISDIICSIFLGQEFIVAGNIARIVAFNSFFTFLMMSTQGIVVILHKQKYSLISAIVQILGYIVGLSIGKYYFNSIYVGCFIMTVIFAIAQVCYFSALFKVVNISVIRYLKSVIFSSACILAGAITIRLACIVVGIVQTI